MAEFTRESVEAEILDLIREFSTEGEDFPIASNATFDDLSISSLDVLQIVFRIEEAHGLSIDTEGFFAVKTVEDVVDYMWNGLVSSF